MKVTDTVIRSPFDGWTKQAFNKRHDDDGYCAVGQISHACLAGRFSRDEIIACTNRVSRYIRANYNLPRYYHHPTEGMFDIQTARDPDTGADIMPIIYANNALRISPERFLAIDQHMQIIEALQAIELKSATEKECEHETETV